MRLGLKKVNWVKFSKKIIYLYINNKIKNTKYEKKN